MTTATATPRGAYALTTGHRDALAGTGTLIRFILRRDRVRLSVWILAIALSVMGSVASFASNYPTAADRQARAEVMRNAVVKLFTGPGFGLDNYTYGAMTANELLPLTAVAVALMSIFLVVRHTRAEEEGGRADLVRAGVVGRHAPTVAALAVVVGANAVLCALLAVGLPASLQGLSTTGSLTFGAALLGVGLVFTGVALLAAQVSTSARGATGLAGMALGAAYLVRAIGDLGNGTPSWFSPFGWATQMRAYVDERWWPLLISIGVSIAITAVAIRISDRRDLGAGFIADRPGPAVASPRLASPFGLALRQQRVTLIWWSVSLFLLGLVYGGAAEEAAKLYEDVDTIDKYLVRVGNAAAADQYLALTLFISALIGVGYAIQSASRPRGEEVASRAEPVLAAAVSRGRFVGSHLAMALGGSVILLFAYGLGAGITRSISVSDAAELPRLVGSAVAYAPALWVFVGLVTAIFGLAPRAIGAVWAVFGAFAFIGFLGPLLKLPDWVYNLSPLEHIPRLPVADFTLTPIVVLTLIAAGLLGIGLAGFHRRDIGS